MEKDKLRQKQYTWRNKSFNIASRIDFVFVSKDLKKDIIKYDIRPVVCGDHNAVTIMFKVAADRGPGFWKFNTNLLTKDDYCKGVRKIAQNVIREQNTLYIPWKEAWEFFKIRVREYSIDYAKNMNLKNKDDAKILENRLQKLNNEMWESNDNKLKQILEEYEIISEQLEIIYK